MRVATIDIGTNTVLLLVAERDEEKVLRAVREEATITRLGEGVDQTGALEPRAVGRTRDCLTHYASITRELSVDRVLVAGTSAMRDAAGDEIRTRVRELWGVEAKTLSGEEEARLTFRGALSGLRLPDGDVGAFDVGGGSTEVVIGDATGRTRFARSFDVGSVRLTERHIRHDPPTSAELSDVESSVRAAFEVVPELSSGAPVIGIAGTMTTLAAVYLEMPRHEGPRVNGRTLARSVIEALTRKLAKMSTEERCALPGLDRGRADVIVAGGIIAIEAARAFGAKDILVSDRGVRWGLAEELSAGQSI